MADFKATHIITIKRPEGIEEIEVMWDGPTHLYDARGWEKGDTPWTVAEDGSVLYMHEAYPDWCTIYGLRRVPAPPAAHWTVTITLVMTGSADDIARALKASIESGAVQTQISDAADDLGLDDVEITEADYEVTRG